MTPAGWVWLFGILPAVFVGGRWITRIDPNEDDVFMLWVGAIVVGVLWPAMLVGFGIYSLCSRRVLQRVVFGKRWHGDK